MKNCHFKIFCVGGVYLHHAGRSGYGLLEHYLGDRWRPHPLLKSLGEGMLRIPGRMLCSHCGLFEYSREDFVTELALIPEYLSSTRCIWHFLYAEKQYFLTALLPSASRRWCVGTFHHHPVKFPFMVQRTAHYRTLDLAITVSTVQIEFLEQIVGKGKVVFVPHGIDTDYWTPGEFREHCRRKILLFAGCHMRDFICLGRVIEHILAKRNDVEFILISPERECGSIYRRPNVRWLYRIPDDEYLRWMQRATLLVLPLKYSTAVNTALEALACGTPVITTEGGISDYLDDSCSLQFKRGDAEGMAKGVLELLDSGDTLIQMRSAARQKALEFSWPKVAARIRQIFAERFA